MNSRRFLRCIDSLYFVDSQTSIACGLYYKLFQRRCRVGEGPGMKARVNCNIFYTFFDRQLLPLLRPDLESKINKYISYVAACHLIIVRMWFTTILNFSRKFYHAIPQNAGKWIDFTKIFYCYTHHNRFRSFVQISKYI